ncbi:DUF2530 domain-containing protein [Actinobacteria bacterium YIM 96077]|uniref:DUF2530 domain-containing protein n=1 Tax=Phytoactinopolyspora halophila TaxID=1981511 RepID=A0A329R0C5_9ACTN|nr:DUF2530 domain-containing protein [Phytoactinopolyspora halophila]AYY11550.1 DUF2530 domain-containing protein [Actinobacteria bacterium YIM 96077]RAW17967.1 hypothetical protein DPM12_03760 [Phytoactinopolyspora halophila]
MGKGRRRTREASDVQPLDVDGVRTVAILTVLWAVAFVVLAFNRARLEQAGHGWLLWTCLAGVGAGLLGIEYTRKRREAIAEAEDEDEVEVEDGEPDPLPAESGYEPGPVTGTPAYGTTPAHGTEPPGMTDDHTNRYPGAGDPHTDPGTNQGATAGPGPVDTSSRIPGAPTEPDPAETPDTPSPAHTPIPPGTGGPSGTPHTPASPGTPAPPGVPHTPAAPGNAHPPMDTGGTSPSAPTRPIQSSPAAEPPADPPSDPPDGNGGPPAHPAQPRRRRSRGPARPGRVDVADVPEMFPPDDTGDTPTSEGSGERDRGSEPGSIWSELIDTDVPRQPDPEPTTGLSDPDEPLLDDTTLGGRRARRSDADSEVDDTTRGGGRPYRGRRARRDSDSA